MTSEQRQQALAMRQTGMGYARIATTLNLSINTVKSFCQRSAREKTLEGQQPDTTSPVKSSYCKNCGKTIVQQDGRKAKLYCSDHCRMAWWNSHLDQVNRRAMAERTCPTCGKSFLVYGKKAQKYCSHACYIQMRFGGGRHE